MNPRLTHARAASHVMLDVAAREVRAAAELEASALADREDQAAIGKSNAYMYAAAALERSCREVSQIVIAEINAEALAPQRLRASLFTLHCNADLDVIADHPKKSLERYARATEMFEAMFGAVHVPLGPVLPLDGRTPRAPHFATLWRVFGFPGPSLPHPDAALALDDLADGRNTVAHGVLDAIAFGRSRALADVARLVARLDEVIAHLFDTADGYLGRRLFLR